VPYASAGNTPPPKPKTAPAPAPSKPAALSSPPAKGSMSDAERSKAIAAAIHQTRTAGEIADRKAIEDTLKANGYEIEAWFADFVPDATFLGRKIQASGGRVPGVHRTMLDALKRAERKLLADNPGRSAAQLGKDFGIYEISGLRLPKKATGGKLKLPSYHCFGLAVDINHPTNPFVGNLPTKKKGATFEKFKFNRSPRIIQRAMEFLRGEKDFNVEAPLVGAKNTGQAWDIHHRASETLAEYLRLADDIDGQRVRDLVAEAQSRGDTNSLQWWKSWIATDRAVIKNWDFQHHPNPEKRGYMDLPRELVVALVGAGLAWGGQYNGPKDIMHFDLRKGPIRQRT
jgi:hypothetical protein